MSANSAVLSSPALTWSIAAAAAGAIAGALLAAQGVALGGWLHWLCKPLATALIFALAWRVRDPVSPRYRRWVLLAIACSLGGDVFLMLPQDLFVAGLLAFLCAHACLLVAWLGDSRLTTRPGVLLAAYGYGALNLYLLWDAIEGALRVPVIIYVLVLATAGGQAVARALAWRGSVRSRDTRFAAIGALLFMLSDSVLAWDRFRGPLAWASLWILATYYLSLWWIARSVQRSGVRA